MLKAKRKVAIKPNQESGKITVNMRVNKVKPNKVNNKAILYKDKQNRTQIFKTIADNINISKITVEKIFNELYKIIEGHLSKKGSGEITVPKIGVKLRRIKKKATKERSMISPLTGQKVLINAKPARLTVKLIALKSLKQVVNK